MTKILEIGDTGTHEELSILENPDDLILQYLPPIEALLERAKQLYERELSEAEEQRIRKNAQVIATPRSVHEAIFGDANQ